MNLFAGGMGELDGRPEGDHVHPREFFADDAALQAGMDGCDTGLRTKLILVDILQDLKQGRLQVGFPAGVAFLESDVRSGQAAQCGQNTPSACNRRGDGAAGAADDFSSTNVQVSGVDEADIIKNDGEYIYMLKDQTVRII